MPLALHVILPGVPENPTEQFKVILLKYVVDPMLPKTYPVTDVGIPQSEMKQIPYLTFYRTVRIVVFFFFFFFLFCFVLVFFFVLFLFFFLKIAWKTQLC